MPIQRSEAIVLSRYDLRETSLIANFYTKDFGKVCGVLKGIRREPYKFASTLELFSYNEIIFYQKRNSSVHLISQCDLRENFDKIRQDILKVGVGSIIVELLEAIMPQEDPNSEIFDLSLMAIRELEASRDPDKIRTIFKIKLLALSGFKPHLDSCVSCGFKLFSESKFSLALGGLLCDRCSSKDLRARSIFRGTIASILHIEKNDFKINLNLGMNPEIKKELELVLDSFLNFHLGKELRSQKVMNKMEALL